MFPFIKAANIFIGHVSDADSHQTSEEYEQDAEERHGPTPFPPRRLVGKPFFQIYDWYFFF